MALVRAGIVPVVRIKPRLTLLAAVLAFAGALASTASHAQGLLDFPQTLPPNTVLGRTGIGAGPVQALPFTTLFSLVKAATQTIVVSPTAPNSTSLTTMQGLGGAIIPATSGRILITISGTIVTGSGTADVGVVYQIATGTGTAPTSNAVASGTLAGSFQEYTNPAAVTAADVNIPFSTSAIVTGLTVGTAYWIDLQAKAITSASQASFSGVVITAVEL